MRSGKGDGKTRKGVSSSERTLHSCLATSATCPPSASPASLSAHATAMYVTNEPGKCLLLAASSVYLPSPLSSSSSSSSSHSHPTAFLQARIDSIHHRLQHPYHREPPNLLSTTPSSSSSQPSVHHTVIFIFLNRECASVRPVRSHELISSPTDAECRRAR